MLKLRSYRKKGINAYLKPIGGAFEDCDYGDPATQADRELARERKAHWVSIDTSKKADGYYLVKEADGKCENYRWLKLAKGEVVAAFDTEKEFLAMAATTATIDLPVLLGSEKQIAWGSKIRQRLVVSVGDRVNDWSEGSPAFSIVSKGDRTTAQWWIDNRDWYHVGQFLQELKTA